MKKVVRYDNSTTSGHNHLKAKESLQRSNKTHVVININDRSDSKEDQPMGIFNPLSLSSFTPPVSCIAVSPYSMSLSNDSRYNSPLVITGRIDGSIDLFYLESGEILTTWSELSSYQPSHARKSSKSSTSSYDPTSAAIVYAAWISWNSPTFVVIDTNGMLYYFDLYRDASKPLFIEELSVSSTALLPNLISLSTCRSVGGLVHLAIGEVDHVVSNHGIKIRKVADELIWSTETAMNGYDEKESEGKFGEGEGKSDGKKKSVNSTGGPSSIISLSSQSSWIGRVTGENIVMEYRGGSSSDRVGRK